MHPLAYEHLKKVLEDKKLVGCDEGCEYYPCHFTGQDCTWCFCPFYPCEDEQTGGERVKTKEGGRIWSCSYCYWIHESEVAKGLLEEFKKRGIDSVEDIEKRKEEVKEIFAIMLSPCLDASHELHLKYSKDCFRQ
jgi:Zn-finger protein